LIIGGLDAQEAKARLLLPFGEMKTKEESVLNTRLGRMMYLLLAGVFLTVAFLLVRARRAEQADMLPFANPKDAAKTYRQRLKQTERLLESSQYESSRM